MDPVPAGSAAYQDYQVSCLGLLFASVLRYESKVSAKYQRVAYVSFVKKYGAVGSGNAHTVSVVPDSLHYAFKDTSGMQRTLGYLVVRHVWRSETEDVRIHNGFCSKATAEYVPDDPSNTRTGAAVRLYGGGVVVRLHLEADTVVFVKLDDACVVLKHAQAPGLTQFVRGPHYGLFQRVIYHLAVIVHKPAQGLVHTVFRPGLCNGLQFDIRRFSADICEIFPNRLHLLKVQVQLPLFADGQKRLIGGMEHGNGCLLKDVVARRSDIRYLL